MNKTGSWEEGEVDAGNRRQKEVAWGCPWSRGSSMGWEDRGLMHGAAKGHVSVHARAKLSAKLGSAGNKSKGLVGQQ
jgi:hypothetical protein